ncbi:MAG TPA: RHS repeat-associated core domain-containing protein, partial [Flavitalea sp.]|nr:RHS repeat-associated core domain-containing protein [Flavitalea sp.]
NHLGNVLAVITDNVNMVGANFNAIVARSTDYYAFGLEMEGRTFTDESVYRYGFNGKEKDDEDDFGDTSYDYGFRIYNPRIARFLSVDPLSKSFPELTPYQFASNSPISAIDLDGLEAKLAIILETHPEKFEFDDHLKALGEGGYTVIKILNGEQLLSELQNNSSEANTIKDLIIISHSAEGGLFGQNGNDNGFYTPASLTTTASQKIDLDLVNSSEFAGDIEKFLKYQEGDEYKKKVEDYELEMIEKGARTTADLKVLVDKNSIIFDKNALAIMLGGCSTVSINPDGTTNSTIATKIVEAINIPLVGSSTGTSPVVNSSRRKGKWYLLSSDGKTGTKVETGGTIDLTKRNK